MIIIYETRAVLFYIMRKTKYNFYNNSIFHEFASLKCLRSQVSSNKVLRSSLASSYSYSNRESSRLSCQSSNLLIWKLLREHDRPCIPRLFRIFLNRWQASASLVDISFLLVLHDTCTQAHFVSYFCNSFQWN